MPKTLFIGLGNTPPAWYRCGIPAYELGKDADWIGAVGNPSDKLIITGSIESYPDGHEYDAIVIQQAYGDDWLRQISEWQDKGIKVIYECDDFLHGIRKIENHMNRKKFHKKKLKEFQSAMAACDAMICSTDFLSDQYKKYNPNQYVCKVGIDTKRYDIEFPNRDWITIGWAGGTGHDHAADPWLTVISKIMNRHNNVAFCSIGTNYAKFMSVLHPHRCLGVPWVSIENLPYALTNMDIAIAPAHESKYHLSKSDLRWLEAGAVGLPVVADSRIYKNIEHGVTGITVDFSKRERKPAEELEDELETLVYSESDRQEIGSNAKEYIQEHRDSSVSVNQWRETITSVLSSNKTD